MKKTIFILLIFCIGTLHASKYAIVVNKNSDISILTEKEIKDIFLLKRHFIHHTKIIPVNASSTHFLRKEFENNILKIQRTQLNKYWIKKHFQGISPPLTQVSNRAIKLFIKNVKGSIGYLPLTQIDKDLKVIYEF